MTDDPNIAGLSLNRRRFLRAAAGAGVVSPAAILMSDTGAGQSVDSNTHEVEMITTEGQEYIFDPIGLRVEPGDTVRWMMVSGAHSATAYAEDNGGASERRIPEGADPWNSGIFTETGAEFEYTFEEEGTYDYFCIPQKTLGMIGRIVCGEPGGPAEESENPDVDGISTGKLPSSEAIVKNEVISYPYEPPDTGGSSGDESESDSVDTPPSDGQGVDGISDSDSITNRDGNDTNERKNG